MLFTSVARKLESAAHSGRALAPLLESTCPQLVRDIRADLASSALLRLWGWSKNWDEFVNAPILDPRIINAICQLGGLHTAKLRTDDAIHAGVMHTYCYLFSRLRTKFGYKRDRWTKGQIAQILDLPQEVLSAEPSRGTLLTNATYLLGRIAFRGDARRMATLRRLRTRVPKEIRRLPFAKLSWSRIVETAKVGQSRQVEFRTDLVPAIDKAAKTALVVYSLVDQTSGADASPVLVTAFPTRASVAQQMLDADDFGKRVKIRPRYNAWVSHWPARTVQGERAAWHISSSGLRRMR